MSYTPASILTSGALPNLQATYYERQAIPNLKASTPFMGVTKQKPLPLRAGNTVQFYTYALLGANTTPATEGSVGSPISESTTKITAQIGQYCDFINSSDLSMDVAIDDPSLIGNLADELNYRLALTLNTLVQLTLDSAQGVDNSVTNQLVAGSFVTAATIRSTVQSLATVNARPLNKDGFFGGIIAPTIVRDILNDTSNNGLSDILKRGDAERKMLLAPLSNDDVVEFAGVRFKQTTTTPVQQISGANYYTTYIVGDDACFSVFLGPNPETKEKNYKLMIQTAPENGSVSDPARQIGGWVSYNTKYTNTLRPGSTMTLRRILSETSSS